jgi:hypothetical protein
MRRAIWPLSVLGFAFASILTVTALQTPLPAGAEEPPTTVGTVQVFLPGVLLQPTFTPKPTFTPSPTATPTDTPVPEPTADCNWDERLTQRFAQLIPATVEPGQGYWKLVKARWVGPADTPPFGVGDHDIAVDVRDEGNNRAVGKQLRVGWWIDGDCPTNLALLPEPRETETEVLPQRVTSFCVNLIKAEAKPGEAYAGSYPMYHIAPTYRVQVDDGNPSDAVDGLGMGSIEDPYRKVHTSYGLTWRWTVAGSSEPAPTATEAPTATATATDELPPDTTPTVTSTPSATPTETPTETPIPTTPPANRTWDPRLTARGAAMVTAQVQPGQGYWRLVSGVWYDEAEPPAAYQGLIWVDTRDKAGNRQTNVAVQIANMSGDLLGTLHTEAKPGEPYAANFPMYWPAPTYQAWPLGAPADIVTGLGRGNLSGSNPYAGTRYGFTWQWTIAGNSAPDNTQVVIPAPSDLQRRRIFLP